MTRLRLTASSLGDRIGENGRKGESTPRGCIELRGGDDSRDGGRSAAGKSFDNPLETTTCLAPWQRPPPGLANRPGDDKIVSFSWPPIVTLKSSEGGIPMKRNKWLARNDHIKKLP